MRSSQSKNKLIAIILAAGAGTRMNSSLPKVLHKVIGKTLLDWVLSATKTLNPLKNIVVIGHQAEKIVEHFNLSEKQKNLEFAIQKKQLGSSDAVKSALPFIPKNFDGNVLILCGDTPLISSETLENLIKKHTKENNAATILTAVAENPFSYGRIKRNKSKNVIAIVEEKDATLNEKKIKEINSGIYCFKAKFLKELIPKIKPNNTKKEYYLTDIIKFLVEKNEKVNAFVTDNFSEIIGINDRIALSDVNKKAREKINLLHLRNGVNILFPETVYISPEVKIGRDTTIYHGAVIKGDTEIGEFCKIGPNSTIENSKIENYTNIQYSQVVKAEIGNEVRIGPFSNIRPKTKLDDGCKVGNFSEIKNARVGKNSKISHLSYIGDAKLGKNVNIGAGTITCNYDGKNKYETIIEDDTFIGSNTNLVAPVAIGKRAIVGAGSTIYEDVPEDSLAIARSKQENKIQWVKKRKSKNAKSK